MSFTTVPTVSNGDSWSAAQHNTYLRDNMAALFPFTTEGDLAYASASNALGRLGIGSAKQGLRVNAGATAPEWGHPWLKTTLLTRSGDGSVAGTVIPWDTEVKDDGGWHSNVTNNSRITVDEAGVYLPLASIGVWVSTGGTTGELMVQLRVNNVLKFLSRKAYILDGQLYTLEIPGVPLVLSANDYVTIVTNGTMTISGAYSFFGLVKVQ